MDIEQQPIKIFIREAMLRTPQGLVVLASFIVNWVLVLLTILTNLTFILPESGPALIYVVIFPWPFIVFLIFVQLSSPHYYASMSTTLISAGIAVMPYWWLYA